MSLDLELQKRNARLRAFRALGVPVEGGWALDGTDSRGHRWVIFRVWCGACDEDLPGGDFNADANDPLGDCLARHERHLWGWCKHLAPLLQPDPPELAGLLDLELLAGA